MLLDVAGRDGCGDGDHQGSFGEFRPNRLKDLANGLRLDAEENDVRVFYRLAVVGPNLDGEIFAERSGFFGVADGGRDALGREEALLEIGAQENAAKLARAQDGKFSVGEFASHGGDILLGDREVVKVPDSGAGGQCFGRAVRGGG